MAESDVQVQIFVPTTQVISIISLREFIIFSFEGSNQQSVMNECIQCNTNYEKQ
ncbi:14155_t:CDS:2 [Funneliformis caledonium]|uniref:14155_t:CDS:1 n=1 Tax=Funneliformis caledonium TaxID=1117310 RepID=A0A9N9BNW2_9GLOM|nr:14155_t:CDS:2 [Funneliformis caledonium]